MVGATCSLGSVGKSRFESLEARGGDLRVQYKEGGDVSTPRKRPRYMYPDVSDVYPKMYLGLVWDTCKIHAKNQDTSYMYSLGM
jgi:hypothetical protein